MKKILAFMLPFLLLASMANAAAKRVPELTAQSETIADGDLIMGVDVSDTTDHATGTSKKLTWTQIIAYLATVFQASDADLSDLADGTLSGSKVGTGINGDNITSGTVADARIASTIARDTEIPTVNTLGTATLACSNTQIAKYNGSAWVCASDETSVGTGDVASVGDCTSGACLDGTSDGGTIIYLYGPNGFWQALQAGASTANRSWRLPIDATPSAGTTRLMNMDENGQMGFVDPATFLTPSGVGGALTVTATGFDGNLATTDNTLQEIAQKVDDLVISGGSLTDLDDLPGDTVDNNLIDFAILSGVQASDADLTAIAALTCTENQIVKRNSSNTWVCGSDNEGAGGGITHATSDGNYYASRNGAWVSLTGLYAAALSANDNYVTDAQVTLIGNTSGTNSGDITLDTETSAIFSLSTQQLTLDSQTANYIFAAPNSSAGDPTFRAMVDGDIPAAIARDTELPTDATISTSAVSTNDATTSKHGWLMMATAPASGLRNILAIDNAETSYKNAALFDATNPAAEAFGDTAVVGTVMTAARRDHRHAMPASQISDIAYDATTWDSVTSAAPTKNAIRDYLESKIGSGADGGYKLIMTNNTAATPTGSTNELYFEANVLKVNENGIESTVLDSGTAVTPAQGGTGVANGTNNTLTWTGNYTFGGTLTGNTAVTFPTSGTLAVASGALGTPSFTALNLPSSNADPGTTAGQIRHDSTITGMTRGAITWYDGVGVRQLVDLDTTPVDDDYVIAYDADADKFYMKADSGSVLPGLATTGITGNITITKGGTTARTVTFPDAAISVARSDAAQTLTGTQTIATDLVLTSATAGVRLTGGNGLLTIKGEGDGTDEDLTINLNASNVATVSSSTGVTAIDVGTINLVSSGNMMGGVNRIGSFASPTTSAGTYSLTAANSYNSLIFYNDTDTLALPAAVAGMNLCVYVAGTNLTTIDVNGTDVMVVDGTANAAGDAVTIAGAAGNFLCLLADAVNHWVTLGSKGTITAL